MKKRVSELKKNTMLHLCNIKLSILGILWYFKDCFINNNAKYIVSKYLNILDITTYLVVVGKW